jgi:hypothetical protein
LGLASPESPVARPTPTTFRVLTTGDAFTMPEGLDYAQSYPARLEAILRRCLAPRLVQVINAGVTGYGPREELPQLRELVPLFTPDLIVHEFFVNDWSDITVDADDRQRSIGLIKPGGLGSLFHDRSQLIASLRAWYESAAAAITGRPSPEQGFKLMLSYFEQGANPFYDSANVTRMGTFLGDVRAIADSNDAKLLVVYVPAGVSVLPRDQIAYLPRSGVPFSDPMRYDLARPYAPLRRIADSLDVPLLDLARPLRGYQPQPVYYPNAWHWTAAGHRGAAAAIVAELRARGFVSPACSA